MVLYLNGYMEIKKNGRQILSGLYICSTQKRLLISEQRLEKRMRKLKLLSSIRKVMKILLVIGDG
jgi:hypothetical protein